MRKEYFHDKKVKNLLKILNDGEHDKKNMCR